MLLMTPVLMQSLRNLCRSIATLDICGEWRTDSDEATLEIATELVWMQGRAPAKRLSALQVDFQRAYHCEPCSSIVTTVNLWREDILNELMYT